MNDPQALRAVSDMLVNPERFMQRVELIYSKENKKSLPEEIQLKGDKTLERNSSPALLNGGKGYGRIWYFREVTNLKELSIKDPLTGLFNRRQFSDSLNIELSRAERHNHSLSLLMLDIGYFKKVNDTYGHDYWNKVLRKIARTIAKNKRTSDIASRYGGEEFTVILPETNLLGSEIRGNLIQTAIKETLFHPEPEKTERITVSIGVS
jgi:diguanylate cyclase (GGDEF)-like protein